MIRYDKFENLFWNRLVQNLNLAQNCHESEKVMGESAGKYSENWLKFRIESYFLFE